MLELGFTLIIAGLVGAGASFILCVVSMFGAMFGGIASQRTEKGVGAMLGGIGGFGVGMVGMAVSGLVEMIGWVLAGKEALEWAMTTFGG